MNSDFIGWLKGSLKEFFGFGGYQRTPEGSMSPQHLIFVSSLMVLMIALAVVLGLKMRKKDLRRKNRVLIAAAIIMDLLEIFKIVLLCFRENDPTHWRLNLPLFLCSIQLIALPVAAFTRGRLKEAALDFVLIFGALGAVMGTYFAGQNYAAYPVFGFDNVISGLTHAIAGFSAIYIGVSGMASLKKKNIPITFGILLFFCGAAFAANAIIDYNYMFLRRGDGTPYDIFFNLVGGNPVLYPMIVIGLFLLYITVFYLVSTPIKRKR
ncbi:MAG: YwaF family protein [Clostridia bacterium]|nr:YwaF family protein [Clostridia bacterium]